MRTRKNKVLKKSLEMSALKKMLREKIIEEYGSIAEFIKTDEVGKKIERTYLYDGSMSFGVLKDLCKKFNIGNISREIKVVREYSYYIED